MDVLFGNETMSFSANDKKVAKKCLTKFYLKVCKEDMDEMFRLHGIGEDSWNNKINIEMSFTSTDEEDTRTYRYDFQLR